jgi:hypothetical protein
LLLGWQAQPTHDPRIVTVPLPTQWFRWVILKAKASSAPATDEEAR